MVLVKRIFNNGSNGSCSTIVPRAPRSMRRRSLRGKKVESTQLCAFELLATVAGKMLEETECSSASSSARLGFDKCAIGKDVIKKEPLEGEHDDQGSSEESVYFSGNQKGICKQKLESVTAEHVSPLTSSVCSQKVHSESKFPSQKGHDDITRDLPLSGESDNTNNVGNVLNRKVDINEGGFGDIPSSTNSEEIVEFPYFKNSVNDVKLTCKKDDEILSRCSQPNNTRKIFSSLTRNGDRRFRKVMTSKYWKTVPKLKDCEPTNAGGAAKHGYHKRPFYEIDRSQRDTPFKKRRLFERSSFVTYDGGLSCESVSNSPEKNKDDDNITLPEVNEKLFSGFRSQNSCDSENSNVRLSIKSFKVPELFVEVPENTTIGSLKRTVLEAVTSILGGGLRVGILLQGKKLRDDDRTLLQTGISQDEDINTVGFILEPNSPTPPSPPISPKQPQATLPYDSPKFAHRSQLPLKKDKLILGSSGCDSSSPAGSCRDLVPSTTIELPEKCVSDSKALVHVPEASLQPLAVFPFNQRAKRPETGHRRIRRPFSVYEVEALVHAVEILGTGRWRDVKLRSFENAMHRTYVDLKDKWKTLVHTARISPQQRRGEPVPQDLLDRVLAAQAYWSQHQSKHHAKQHQQHNNVVPKRTYHLGNLN